MFKEAAPGKVLAFTVSKQGIPQLTALHDLQALETFTLTLNMENLQYHVAPVEHLVFYALLIRQITGEENSFLVHLRDATSSYGRKTSTTAAEEEVQA